MIQNLRLYVTLNGSGSYALTARLWTRSSSFTASVPVVGATPEKMKQIRSVFSSIRSNFTGLNEEDWMSFDTLLEQMDSKANPIDPALSLSLSLASARAATGNELWKLSGLTNKFPYIMGSAVKGGAWEEFLLIPQKESNIMDAYTALHDASNAIGHELKNHGALRGRSSNGAWLCDLGDTETLFLAEQVARDWNMGIGLNVGGSGLWDGRRYDYGRNRSDVIKGKVSSEDQMSLISAIMEHYKIDYIEDPFVKSDFMSHARLSQKFDTIIAGGELFMADVSRMKSAYRYRPANTVVVNPKNLCTVSQLHRIHDFIRHRGIKLGLSRFSNETGDDWLADLSLAFGADMLKLGITGAANTSKFSRLLEIWDDAQSPNIGRYF
jgi:enolase